MSVECKSAEQVNQLEQLGKGQLEKPWELAEPVHLLKHLGNRRLEYLEEVEVAMIEEQVDEVQVDEVLVEDD